MSAPSRPASVLIVLLAMMASSLAWPAVAAAEPPATPADAALVTTATSDPDAAWRRARGLDPPGLPMIERDAASALASDPMDEHWISGFGLPIPDGPIRELL